MSNILIIKHGSLGDIAQASGAIQDISENNTDKNIYILTTKPYFNFFKKNPYLKDVIIDKRLSRFNLFYLYMLMRKLKKYKFIKVFDLQNSSRTSFYKKILFPKSSSDVWSSSDTTLPKGKTKEEFDKLPVLERFDHQLKTSNLNTKNTLKPDLSWVCSDISKIKNDYNLDQYILLFPFCSPHLPMKKWPYYQELINILKNRFGNKYKICIAPGPDEINEASNLDALIILNNKKSLDIPELASLIKGSSFVVANDTGPAHMSAHLGVNGLALHGSHKSAKLQSIERENFKAIQVSDLNKLSYQKVYEHIINSIY
tara:strand:+ start:1496 stop:2437 length:942 start_codon:yes stop_codon:yes gene_type:complete